MVKVNIFKATGTWYGCFEFEPTVMLPYQLSIDEVCRECLKHYTSDKWIYHVEFKGVQRLYFYDEK